MAYHETRISTEEGNVDALQSDMTAANCDRSQIKLNFAAADSALQSELDASQVGAGLSAAGAYVADSNSNYLDAAASLFDADMKLDAQIKTLESNISSGAISGGALEMKIGTVSGGLMGNFVKKSETFSVADNADTSVTLSEVDAKHSSELEEMAMVFINGQKLRSKDSSGDAGIDYEFSSDATNTVVDFTVGDVRLL